MEKNELFLEVFREVLSKQDIRVEFPSLIGVDVNKLMDSIYYRALNRIKGYIRDDSLSDPDCFQQIELVISTLEHLGDHAKTNGNHKKTLPRRRDCAGGFFYGFH